MNSHRSLAFACVLVTALGTLAARPSQAEPPKENDARVARLIRELGDADHSLRTEANRQLLELSGAGRQQLQEAARAADPEVRLRAQDLLVRLAARELWSGTAISYRSKDASVADALAEVAHQSKNRVLSGDQYGALAETKLDLEFSQTSFWDAVDQICRRSNNRLRPHYDSRAGGIVASAGSPGQYPTAYAGPVRLQITGARRTFIEDLDYEQAKGDVSHAFQFNLQMMWEDRFRLVAYGMQPELVEASADDGAKLSAVQPTASGWNVATPGTRLVTTTLRLSPPTVASRKLATLRLQWPMVAVGDMVELLVTDLTPGRIIHQDDLTLSILSVERPTASRVELALVVSRDLAVPEPQEVLFQENEFQLIDAKERPFRQQSQSNVLSERGVELKLTFVSDAPNSAPGTLRFRYPRVRARRNVEIVFRDVPLPVSRPE